MCYKLVKDEKRAVTWIDESIWKLLTKMNKFNNHIDYQKKKKGWTTAVYQIIFKLKKHEVFVYILFIRLVRWHNTQNIHMQR